MDLGFVGLGIMGKPMASNLLKGGHALHLHSRSGVAPELVAQGGRPCASAAEVARRERDPGGRQRQRPGLHRSASASRISLALAWMSRAFRGPMRSRCFSTAPRLSSLASANT